MQYYELRKIAQQASQVYLMDGTPMNETIIKLGMDNGLNYYQIQRVAEDANNMTRAAFYKDASQDQSRVMFPVANADEINKVVKQAQMESDTMDMNYMSPPMPKAASNKRVEQELIHKAANDYRTLNIVKMQNDLNDLARETKQHDEHLVSEQHKLASAQDDLVHEIYNHIKWGEPLEDLIKVANTIDHSQMLKLVIPLAKQAAVDRVMAENISKLESLINPNIKATYIMGDHPLIIKYNGLATASKSVRQQIEQSNARHSFMDGMERRIEQEKMAVDAAEVDAAEAATKATPAKPPGLGKAIVGGVLINAGIGIPMEMWGTYSAKNRNTLLTSSAKDADPVVQQAMAAHPGVFNQERIRAGLDESGGFRVSEDKALRAANRPEPWSDQRQPGIAAERAQMQDASVALHNQRQGQ